MDAILAMAMKDIRLLLRDRMGAFFAFVFPLIMAVFFGTIFGGGGAGGGGGQVSRIGIILVDEDGTEGAASFAATLGSASEFRVVREMGDGRRHDRTTATDAVRRGDITAFVVIPRGFGEARESMFFGEPARLIVGVDPSRSAERGMLEGLLTKYGFEQMQNGFADPARMREQVRSSMGRLRDDPEVSEPTRRVLGRFFEDLDRFLVDMPAAGPGEPGDDSGSGGGRGGFRPMVIETAEVVRPARGGPSNSYAVSFPQGIIWGVMGCALGFGASLARERSAGTLTRLLVAPITTVQVLAGKGVACFVTTLLVSVAMIALSMAPPFDVRPTSIPLTLMAVFATAVCFVGIMMLLAVFAGSSERGGEGLGWGVLLILAMIGGGMVPLFIMPGWMQTASVISPIRWAVLAIERGVWREATLGEAVVPCAVLVGVGAVGFVVGARVMGRRAAG